MKSISADATQSATAARWWGIVLLLSFLTSVIIVLPFFWLGSASGHDFEFHAASWMDAASQWQDGIFYPHWTKWSNHGFGEPRFIFYPPASWLLGAALSLFVSWNLVPVVMIILSETLAGLAMFALARRMVQKKYALFAAVCYAANPNALLMVYFRSDYAELLACAFFPLALLYGFQLAGLVENRTKLEYGSLIFFALTVTAVWLCNAPAGVILNYSTAGLFLWAAVSQRRWTPLLRGGAALALGLGIASFYLLPAAYEQQWVNIGQALSAGLLPTENFLYTKVADVEHTAFNTIASTIATALLLIAALAAAAIKYNSRKTSPAPQKSWTALIILAGGAGLLMFRITFVFWQYLPKLRFVQFPWRFMSILTVCYAILVAGAMSRRFAGLWLALVIACTSATGIFLVRRTWWDSDDMTTMQEAVEQGDGFDGTDEYDPRGDDHYNLPLHAPLAKALPLEEGAALGPHVAVQTLKWTTNEKEIRVNTGEPVRLALRVLNYPAWRVQVNGKTVQPESADDFAQMIIPLEAGESEIKVSFARTWDRTAGMGISAASILLMLGLAKRPRK